MSSEIDKITNMLSTYIDLHESGTIFFTNATNDFKFIRPSGNPIDTRGYAGMF